MGLETSSGPNPYKNKATLYIDELISKATDFC